jgi:hypothetical protein
MSDHRNPYVGQGADGCRRSAQIDREESHTLDREDPRVERLLESAERWERQAEVLEASGEDELGHQLRCCDEHEVYDADCGRPRSEVTRRSLATRLEERLEAEQAKGNVESWELLTGDRLMYRVTWRAGDWTNRTEHSPGGLAFIFQMPVLEGSR